MSKFSLPIHSIPISKLKIQPTHLRQFMQQNQVNLNLNSGKCNEKTASQFSNLFVNVSNQNSYSTMSSTQQPTSQESKKRQRSNPLRVIVPQHKNHLQDVFINTFNSEAPKPSLIRVHALSSQKSRIRTASRAKSRPTNSDEYTKIRSQSQDQCRQKFIETIKFSNFNYTTEPTTNNRNQFTAGDLCKDDSQTKYEVKYLQAKKQSNKAILFDKSKQQNQIEVEPTYFDDYDEQSLENVEDTQNPLEIEGIKIHGPSSYNIKAYLMKMEQRNQPNYHQKRKQINFQKLQNDVRKTLIECKVVDDKYESEKIKVKEPEMKEQYMFKDDFRDRFGKNIYPISKQFNTPGPGTYDLNQDSLETRQINQKQKIYQQALIKIWQQPYLTEQNHNRVELLSYI